MRLSRSHFILNLVLAFAEFRNVTGLANPTKLKDLQQKFASLLPSDVVPPIEMWEPPAEKTLLEKLNISDEDLMPKKFAVQPSQILDIVASSFQFLPRLATGAFADAYAVQIVPRDEAKYTILTIGDYQIEETCSPPVTTAKYQPIQIYDMEGCPFCRKVREAVTILSLDVEFLPCPMNGPTFRRRYKAAFGEKATVPYMIDPNTGLDLGESDEIVAYLFQVYSSRQGQVIPPLLRPGTLTTVTAGLALLPRFGAGSSYKLSKPPPLPLRLWSYEASPFCKIVKETLCSLEIPHIQTSCPRGSQNRQRLFKLTGRFQVPYLEDPNEGVNLFESAAIIDYLKKRYGIPAPKVNNL
jgi:glutathione S-transferase